MGTQSKTVSFTLQITAAQTLEHPNFEQEWERMFRALSAEGKALLRAALRKKLEEEGRDYVQSKSPKDPT
ncbi:hypothetical protein A3709_10075 [Halioglobus sp. HI00S01]|uniref:hypothetical protein n=1 Tax=Halioglobus sp. HI00S01 TaxID=1822214 RepID=UPI0007C31F77|nr:hypothetical protein [Halioglobus sp. HI00S01]KZX53466.1 hypothetical protein A3709_10075 [Halioglobus sp. HI00S01]